METWRRTRLFINLNGERTFQSQCFELLNVKKKTSILSEATQFQCTRCTLCDGILSSFHRFSLFCRAPSWKKISQKELKACSHLARVSRFDCNFFLPSDRNFQVKNCARSLDVHLNMWKRQKAEVGRKKFLSSEQLFLFNSIGLTCRRLIMQLVEGFSLSRV